MNLDKAVIDRQNILNNEYAMSDVRNRLDIKGVDFDGDTWLTVEQVGKYFDVDRRTIQRYVKTYADELKQNGYRVLTNNELVQFVENAKFDSDINVAIKTMLKARRLGVFNLRAFLNLAMLLVESEKAKELRQLMLSIATDSIMRRSGGNTKYINQQDNRFMIAWLGNKKYNGRLRRAIKNYTTEDTRKTDFAVFNDKTYKSVFKEKNHEYRNILELNRYDKTRKTMYAEVLTTIASYENAVADMIAETAKQQGRKLTREEVFEIFNKVVSNPALEPQIENARVTMASFDNALRDKQHGQLEDYIYPISKAGYERFLNDKNKEYAKLIEQNIDVFERLKDR